MNQVTNIIIQTAKVKVKPKEEKQSQNKVKQNQEKAEMAVTHPIHH